jgi:hypothetical protein
MPQLREMRRPALLRAVSEEEMDKNIGSEGAWPSDFWSVALEPSPSVPRPVLWPSRSEALILVLLLSCGLWAAIWAAVGLLGVGGR